MMKHYSFAVTPLSVLQRHEGYAFLTPDIFIPIRGNVTATSI